MIRRFDEEYEPGDVAIALLESCRAELSLGVPESCDRFHGDGCIEVGEEGVEGAQVAGDVEGCLELPAPSVSNSCTQATEEVELGRVAQATTGRVEAGVEPEAHDCAVPHEVEEAKVPGETALDAADVRGRGARGSRYIRQPEATPDTRLSQL